MELAWLKKITLCRILDKESPDRYTISAPEAEQQSYDYAYVHGSTVKHKDCLFLSWDESEEVVSYMWWPEDAQNQRGTDASCSLEQIIWSTLNVRHRYKTWDIRYTSIHEAFLHDFLFLPAVRWKYQKFRNLFLRPVNADHRIGLLKSIIEMYDKQESITAHELLAKIHGSAIRLSSEYSRLQKNLQFLLDSLKDSGDIYYDDSNKTKMLLGRSEIVPTPKSLKTIASHNEDARRHRDMVRVSRGQLILGWSMFALAAVTLLVEIGNVFHFWN
ncbi:MAG: hypothetical protein AAF434_10395 [Pseudomonadota bacterium]